MTLLRSRLVQFSLGVALVLVAMLATGQISGLINVAKAAISDFSRPCSTADATSGTATTTLPCPIGATHRSANDTVRLQIQVTATSTGVVAPTVNARVEYSYDNIDWYPDAISSAGINQALGSAGATTTQMTSDLLLTRSLKIASSSSQDFGGSGTANRIHISTDLPVKAPYMRVIFTDPAAGGNYGLWAQIFGKLQD